MSCSIKLRFITKMVFEIGFLNVFLNVPNFAYALA